MKIQTSQKYKTKPNTFHEALGKIGIDPERLTQATPKTNQNMTMAKQDPQQQVRGTVASWHNKKFQTPKKRLNTRIYTKWSSSRLEE